MFPKIKRLGVRPKRYLLLTGEKHLIRLIQNVAATQLNYKETKTMNEELNTTTINEVDNTAYIDAIRDLKENTVDRKLYQKLKDERDTLIKSLTNGTGISTEAPVEVRSLADCREDFKAPSKSQCEYMEKVLALRDAAIREGQADPFVAEGHHVKPTAYDYQRAQEIADIYRECLDYAEGDDKVFMNEIQRRIR